MARKKFLSIQEKEKVISQADLDAEHLQLLLKAGKSEAEYVRGRR